MYVQSFTLPRKVKFYKDNVGVSVTNSMSAPAHPSPPMPPPAPPPTYTPAQPAPPLPRGILEIPPTSPHFSTSDFPSSRGMLGMIF